MVVNEYPVPPDDSYSPPPAGVQIRLGGPADGPALARFATRQESVSWSFGRGDQVVVAELAGELVGCCWITAVPFRSARLRVLVRPRPDEWFSYGMEVDRAARRRGVARAIWAGVLSTARQQGIRLVLGHAYWSNRVTGLGASGLRQHQTEELRGLVLFDRYALVLRRRCLAPSLRQPSPAD